MKIRNHRDFWAGVMFIAFGLLFMVLSRQYQVGSAAKMGPGYFPMVLGGLMAFLGLLVLLPSIRAGTPELKVERMDFRSNALVLLAVIVYALTLPTLGFIVAVILLIMISSTASHEFRLKEAMVSSVALLAFSWLVFVKGLELQFPFLPTFLTR